MHAEIKFMCHANALFKTISNEYAGLTISLHFSDGYGVTDGMLLLIHTGYQRNKKTPGITVLHI